MSKKRGQITIDSWLKGHRIPIIITLSVLASTITACIVLVVISIAPHKQPSASDPITDYALSADESEGADTNRIAANTRLAEIKSSEDPVAAAAEAIPEYVDTFNNEESSVADKVTSAIQLASLYRIQDDIISALEVLNYAIDIEGTDSTQKLELLSALEQIYIYGHDLDGQIETIHRILDLPVDSDFTSDHKELIIRDYEYILSSLNDQKNQSDDEPFDDDFDYEFEEDAIFNSEEDFEL